MARPRRAAEPAGKGAPKRLPVPDAFPDEPVEVKLNADAVATTPGWPVHRDAWRTVDGFDEPPEFLVAVAEERAEPHVPGAPEPVPPTSLGGGG